jgi:ribosome maturation factor RimP
VRDDNTTSRRLSVTGQQPKGALLDILSQPLRDSGLDLEDVEVSSAGRRKLVRVLVDKDGGVTLDDIAEATTLVSGVLDEHDVLDDHPYTLEVTSPGVDRPLTQPRHWRRNLNRLVRVQPREGAEFTGRIVDVSAADATVEVDGASRQVAYAGVARATIEIEFNRPAGKVAAAAGSKDQDGKE